MSEGGGGGGGGGGGELAEQEIPHYRILQPGETIQTGDEWWSSYSLDWVRTTLQNSKVGSVGDNTYQTSGNTYRRRIEPQPAICPQPTEHDLSAVRGPTPDELAFHETHTAEIVPAADLRVRIAELETEANRLRAINGDLKIELENFRISAPPAPASEINLSNLQIVQIRQYVRDLLGFVRCQAIAYDANEHVPETILADVLAQLEGNQ